MFFDSQIDVKLKRRKFVKFLEKFLFVLIGYGISAVPIVFILFFIPDGHYDNYGVVRVVFLFSLIYMGRYVSEKLYGLVHKGEKLFKDKDKDGRQ